MTNFPFIRIQAHTSGFTVHIHTEFDTVPRETHCVAGFEQLTELLDKIIVSKGRGASARYEIRPFTHDVPVRTGDNGDGTFSVERVTPVEHELIGTPTNAGFDTEGPRATPLSHAAVKDRVEAAHEAAKVRLHKAAVEQGKAVTV